MNRHLYITSSVAALLAGCAGPLAGILPNEEFVVGAWNPTGKGLEQVRVIDVSNPNRWWFSQALQRPHPSWPNVPPDRIPGFGGDARSGRIPDAVTVQWRDLPAPGAEHYTGTPHGPFVVANIRSRIPSDILRKASQPNYALHVSFTSGVVPVQFNWKLEYFGGPGVGIKEVARGGDSVK
ncbi:MAG: hypothetical protein J0M28_08575 [Thauera sp.]|nr:hypothetical protein [Thauera sp.]